MIAVKQWQLYCVILSVLCVNLVSARITIDSNGYRNLLIAISDDVDEDTTLVTRLRDVFTAASEMLYTATR